jgi:guanosine-3',5'-bis(diphosphate) 3'-pyrophosphohydrolase
MLGEQAKAFAIYAHGEQMYGDKPYARHLEDVVATLVRFGFEEDDYVAAGWLHDVLEDTPVQADELKLSFGPVVTARVWAVTGIGKNRAARNADAARKMLERPDAIPVKLADRYSNARDAQVHRERVFYEMYRKEYPAFREKLYVASKALDDPRTELLWTQLDLLFADKADTPHFHAIRWHRIRDRGFCAVVECDRERDRECSGLIGLVVIDGEPFECVSVERHALGFSIQPEEPIGLLVREAAKKS